MNKDFTQEFYKFMVFIERQTPFALSRFGDGEMMIINNQSIDLLKKGVGEFEYIKDSEKYHFSRKKLSDSFIFKNNNYYVGIACQCCVGFDKFKSMLESSGQNIENLTWANIFVNSNFKLFEKEMYPLLNEKKIILICHEKSKTKGVFKNIQDVYKVNSNAWVQNIELINIIKNDIKNKNIKNTIFLFSAGPFSNILCYELSKDNFDINYNNIFIDIGSVLDKRYELPITRKYLRGGDTINKVCVWQ